MPQLRLLHIALSLSAVIMTAIFGSLRSVLTSAPPALPQLLTLVILGFAGMLILSAAVLRTRIPAMEGGVNADEWVANNKAQCLILWAMLEGSAVLCGLALFLGARTILAAGLAAGALGFLVSQSPGTVAGH